MIKQISREQAEEFFSLADVVEKKIEQSETELKLSFSLSDRNILQICYDLKKHNQTFFIDQFSEFTSK